MTVLLCTFFAATAAAAAKEPGWSGTIIARGAEKQRIENTPILKRPYRPLHFYGNTVRRRYYRGSVRPTLGDFALGTTAWIFRW